MKAPLSKAPGSLLLAGMLCGILCCVAVRASSTGLWLTTGAALFLTAILALRRRWLAAMSVCFIAIGALTTAASVPSTPPAELCDGRMHTLTGRVENVEQRANSQLAEIAIAREDGCGVGFKILLTIGDLLPTLEAGERVKFSCRVEPVDFGEQTEGEWQLIPYTYYYTRGAGAHGFCTGEGIQVISAPAGSLRFLPQRIARERAEVIGRSRLDSQAQALLLGTILGQREAVGSDVREGFNALGVAHLLCVSGYHVGLVAWIVIASLGPLKALRQVGRLRNLLAALLVWVYVLVCGAQPAAVRAGIMVSVYLLAAYIEEDSQPLNSLCIAALIILWFNPFQLYNAGFQLSVCAVAGILLFSEKLNPFPERHLVPHSIAAIFLLPISAILGTLPAQLAIFHSFPMYFLPANIVVAFGFPLFLIAATGAIGLGNLGAGVWVAAPANFLAEGTEKICNAVTGEQLRLEDIYITDYGIALVAIALIVLGLALRVPYGRERGGMILMAGLLAALGLNFAPKAPEGAVLYGWEERGKTYTALQRGEKVKVFSENGRTPGGASMSFLRMRGARQIEMPEGRKGFPSSINHHAGKSNMPDTISGKSIRTTTIRSNTIYRVYPPEE